MNRKKFLASFVLAATIASPFARAIDNHVLQATQPADLSQPTPIIEDLGDLRPLSDKPLSDHINFTLHTEGDYVSNARLIGNNGSSDFLSRSSLSASLNEPLSNGFSFDALVRADSFIYAQFSKYSFFGVSSDVRLNYQPKPNMPTFYIALDPYWYGSVRTGNQLADAFGISAGVQKNWGFNRDKTMLFASYNFTSFYDSPNSDSRYYHAFTVGVTQQLFPAAYGQLYYSFQINDFNTVSRDDYRNYIGLNFVYEISKSWSANLSATFDNNNSNIPIASYQNVTVGAGLSFNF